MIDKRKLNKLESFIENIKNQEIKLIDLSFNSNDAITGIFGKNEIERNFKFGLRSISIGENKTTKSNNKIFMGEYIVELEDTIKDENVQNNQLLKIDLTYSLIINLDNNLYKSLFKDEDEAFEIAKLFFSHSGKLIIFPYIRHLIDLLSREAGIITYPIKPIIFKK